MDSTQPRGQTLAYVRVSTADQNVARQIEALNTYAGTHSLSIDKTYTDKISGSTRSRPQLDQMLSYVRDGDLVLVTSPDRLARSTRDLLDLVELVKNKGAQIRFVANESLNTDSPQGEFMLTILAAVAQLERATIKERQAEGIAIAKAKGTYQRGTRLDAATIASARDEIARGVPKAHIARTLGVSRTTLNAAINSTGAYSVNAA